MKEGIKKITPYLLILFVGYMSNVVLKQCTYVPVTTQNAHTTDTIIKIKYVPQIIKVNNPPVKVIVYKDRDTTLRKEREKQPIIEDIDIKKNGSGQVTEVDITKIDSTGAITTDVHKTDPNSGNLEIDNTGQVEEKKKTRAGKVIQKTWKGFKTGLMIVGGITIVAIAVAHL